jgi:hypothetical protein
MRLTILHALVVLLAAAAPARAQEVPPDPGADPFSARRWHFELDVHAALEAWNYNDSHEELYGLGQTLTYGIRDGLALRAGQRFIYVSQRAEDGVLLGLTIGIRGRVFERGRVAAFLQGDVGVSYTAIAGPPRGTRFNYLAMGGPGLMIRVNGRAHAFTILEVVHVSNNGLKGRARNPDIEAVGLSMGVNVRF